MKYLVLGFLCLFMAGCASSGSGGGHVVGNGMAASDTATPTEGSMEMMTAEHGESCGCGDHSKCSAPGSTCGMHDPKSEGCACGHHKKDKAKKKRKGK